jgi:hypothetical protein
MLLSVWCYVLLLQGSFLFENYYAWSNSYFCKSSWTMRLQTNLHAARQNLTMSPLSIQNDSNRELNNSYLKKDEERIRQITNGLNKEVSGGQRAIQQVAAIMDLYNMTNTGVSELIVSKALEGLVRRVYQDETVDGALLTEIEDLFWRLDDMPVVIPTYLSVETLWLMQQRYYQQSQLCGKHIGRSVHLLMSWSMWANQKTPSSIPKPPDEFIYSTFSLAKESNVSMSFRMWDLYRYIYANVPQTLSRDFYCLVQDVLAKSPGSWKARHCYVLQDLERRYQSSGDISMAPSNAELETSLGETSRYGQASAATWVFRMLRARQSKSQTRTQAHLKLWFQALRRSSEVGSAVYLERLLVSSFEADETTDDYDLYLLMRHRIYYNMALQKWSTMKTPGAGMRAQALFHRMVTKYQTSGDENLRPNEESVHHVVMAFVREENTSLQNLLDAHRFLRQSLQLGSLRDRTTTRHWRTFDNLLESYTKYPDDRLAVEAADRLFRFFLLQHRDGHVSEEPDPFHLSHTLKAWHKSPNAEGAIKSLEFFRLLDSLYHQGKIQLQPDAYNIRQLLGTVAQSYLTGQGEYAASLLARVLETDALPPSFDATAVGTLFGYVIKCNCNDRTAEGLYRARKVLEAFQNYHSENPSTVKLTGAPYKTLLKEWAHIGGSGAGEQVQAILEHFERQHFAGNKHTKLSGEFYADAIKAWTKDPSPNAIRKVDELNSRWNELSQQGIPDVAPHPSIEIAVAAAHATCPDGSLEKAEQMLMDLNSRYETGDDSARVSSYAWHALLEAISKKAPEEECLVPSQSLFDKMKQQDRSGRPVADLRCWAYESLMRSWSRSGDPAAVSEMENIYSSLMKQYKGGSTQLQPSSAIVDLLLEKYNGVDSSGEKEEESPEDDEVAEKALALFQEATKQFKGGNARMKPGRSTIWLVLAALGRSGQSSKYDKVVEEVIQWRDGIF